MDRRPHAVIIPHVSQALSHLLRGSEVCSAFVAQGWRVSIVASHFARAQSAALGIEHKIYPVPWNWGHNQYRPEQPSYQSRGYVDTIRGLEEQLNYLRPDVIIGIPGIASFQLARRLRIPHLSILHGPWLVPILGPSLNLPLRGFAQAAHFMDQVIKGPIQYQLSVQAKALGASPVTYEEFLQSEDIAIAHSGLKLPGSPNRYTTGFIAGNYGPVVDLTTLVPDVQQFCCISFGTAVEADIGSIVATAAQRYEHVIAIVGAAHLQVTAANVTALPAIAPRSLINMVSVAISHGGIGTIAAFSSLGSKQLLIPTDIDQAINAGLASERGMAETIGLDAWIGRRHLGRHMPLLRGGEIEEALRRVDEGGRPAALPLDGAAHIVEVVARLTKFR